MPFLRYVFCSYLVFCKLFVAMSSQSESQYMYLDSDSRCCRFKDNSSSVCSSSIDVLYIEALPYFTVTYFGTCLNPKLLRQRDSSLRCMMRYANLQVNLQALTRLMGLGGGWWFEDLGIFIDLIERFQ